MLPVVFLFYSATKAAAIGASTKHRLVHPMLLKEIFTAAYDAAAAAAAKT